MQRAERGRHIHRRLMLEAHRDRERLQSAGVVRERLLQRGQGLRLARLVPRPAGGHDGKVGVRADRRHVARRIHQESIGPRVIGIVVGIAHPIQGLVVARRPDRHVLFA
ncbi:hypothetical protein G6F31_019942 [Rhizopus arrhizus]|nr:hypothetical protein G6F31_019942 [Rhizopus arrhizus]